MTPSKQLYEFIEKEEGGLYTHAYLDQAGIPTIGIGSTMYKDGRRVKMGDTITEADARILFDWEIDNKAKSVDAFTKNVVLKQHQFDSLVSFAFNAGVGALEGSTLLKTIIQGPNNYKTFPVKDLTDPDVKHWLESKSITAITNITFYFCLWCKITVKDETTGEKKKILSDGLIKRRLREAAMYLNN